MTYEEQPLLPLKLEYRYRRLATALYCCVQLVNGLSVNIIGPTTPFLTKVLNTTVAHVGNILAAEGAAVICASLFISVLLARLPGHAVISVLCFVIFGCLWSVPSCESVLAVSALYFGVGACLGMMSGMSNAMISWVHAGRNVGPWVNLINAFFGLGASSAPLLFTHLHADGSELRAFSAIACFAAGTAAFAALLRSPAAPPTKPTEALPRTARKGGGGGGGGAARGTSELCGIDLGSRDSYVTLTVVAPLMALLTLGIGGEIAYGAWVYSYATERVGMERHDAAYLNSFFWSAFTVGRLCAIPLAAVVLPEQLLVPSMAAQVAFSLLVLLSDGSTSALWLATGPLAVGFCGISSNVLSLLASYDLNSPLAVSLLQLACGVGHMTVPNYVEPEAHSAGPISFFFQPDWPGMAEAWGCSALASPTASAAWMRIWPH